MLKRNIIFYKITYALSKIIPFVVLTGCFNKAHPASEKNTKFDKKIVQHALNNTDFTLYVNAIVLPYSQEEKPTVFIYDNKDMPIPDAKVSILCAGKNLVVQPNLQGKYTFSLPDSIQLHECLLTVSRNDYSTQSQLFLGYQLRSVKLILGGENDLFLPKNNSLFPVSQYGEFLAFMHKDIYTGKAVSNDKLIKEVEERILSISSKYHLNRLWPLTTYVKDLWRIKNVSPLVPAGFHLPSDSAQRKLILADIEKDPVLYPQNLYVLWGREPYDYICIASKRVVFYFPDHTTDSQITKLLSGLSFQVESISPPSHRLYAQHDKLVTAFYNKVLSNDMIRKASSLVREGKAFSYSLVFTGEASLSR